MASKAAQDTVERQPRTLIIGIYAPDNPIRNIASYLEEFRNLVSSSGRSYDKELYIKLRSIDPGYFITKGKLDEIKQVCEQEQIEEIIVSEPLTVMQERNLSKLLNTRIIDRTLLILEIFERGAVSSEGKKQVALARLQYEKGRLAGHGIHLSQQAGRIGGRGPGETLKERETQHIERLMTTLRKDLAQLERVRQTQRKKRVTSRIPVLSLIGYTNAGKSTILNALTKGGVLAENKLFSTLDTTTRELYIDGQKKGVLADTVGFIQQLPHHLVEAFKSTLAELQYATLLLHVIDVSDPNWPDHIAVVQNVLQELNAGDKPVLYIFNKSDKIDPTAITTQLERYKPYILVSAVAPHGIDPLITYLKNWQSPLESAQK